MNLRPVTGWLAIAVLAALAAGCGKPIGLENRACPCLMDAGFVCCETTCIRAGAPCPSQAAVVRDGPAGTVDAPVDGPLADARPADARPEDASAVLLDASADAPTPDSAPDAEPLCGRDGQRCCPGNSCSNGGCCAENVCLGIGDACPLRAASCFGGSCGGECGGRGEACCGGTCTTGWTSCQGTPCRGCGSPGEPCCGQDCLPGSGTVCTPDGDNRRCLRP
jgi:hypothetical protein